MDVIRIDPGVETIRQIIWALQVELINLSQRYDDLQKQRDNILEQLKRTQAELEALKKQYE